MLLAIAVSYVLVHGSTNIRSGNDLTLSTVLARRKTYGDEFLWFRYRGVDYIVRDGATLDRIDHLFDGERSYDPEASRVERELRPLEQRESELDRQIDALTDRDEDSAPLTADEETRLHSLQREMDALHDRMRVLERQEEDV